MSQPTKDRPTPSFYDKHKDKILIGAILYLFGVNQEQKSQLKSANERADKAELRYNIRLEREVTAANQIAFRQMLRSDSTFIIGRDSVLHLPLPDTTQKE